MENRTVAPLYPYKYITSLLTVICILTNQLHLACIFSFITISATENGLDFYMPEAYLSTIAISFLDASIDIAYSIWMAIVAVWAVKYEDEIVYFVSRPILVYAGCTLWYVSASSLLYEFYSDTNLVLQLYAVGWSITSLGLCL